MTRKEAIAVLECLALEMNAILAGIPKSEATADQIKRCIDAYDMAISALRQQEIVTNRNGLNEPLTLDELRQMDGEPVWIVEEPDWGHWELSADADDYVADREPSFYGMKHNDPAGRYGLHKLGWLAYRQKQEEGTV